MPKFCTTCGKPLQFENAEICPSCGVRIHEPPKAAEEIYAGVWDRWTAYLIDFFIGLVFFIIVFLVIYLPFAQGGTSASGSALILGLLLGFVAYWLYYAYYESSPSQATLGKKVLKIKVTDEQGHPISFAHSLARSFFKILFTITPLGIIVLINAFVIHSSAERKGIHDYIVHTHVIKANQETPQ